MQARKQASKQEKRKETKRKEKEKKRKKKKVLCQPNENQGNVSVLGPPDTVTYGQK